VHLGRCNVLQQTSTQIKSSNIEDYETSSRLVNTVSSVYCTCIPDAGIQTSWNAYRLKSPVKRQGIFNEIATIRSGSVSGQHAHSRDVA